MQKILRYFIIGSLAAFSLIACEETDDIVATTDTPVVSAYLHAGQACDSIMIHKAISYNGMDSTAVPLDDLLVTIDDGEQTYTLQAGGGGRYYNEDLIFQSGSIYTLAFDYEGEKVMAATFVPYKQEATISSTYIELERIEEGSGPPFGGGEPESSTAVEITWDNTGQDYFYVLVQNLEENPEYINEFTAVLDSIRGDTDGFRFISEPQVSDYYNIDPNRELRQFGLHRIVVFRVNPEYAALYGISEVSSLSITEPPSNVTNGLGLFTGVASDTLYLTVAEE